MFIARLTGQQQVGQSEPAMVVVVACLHGRARGSALYGRSFLNV